MHLKSLIYVFVALPILCAGQDFRSGYVVKPGNDTLRGLVSYRSGRSVPGCEFKVDRKSASTNYTADELIAYQVDLIRYEAIKLDSDTLPKGNVFMRVLAKGTIDLYRYGRFFFAFRDVLIGFPEPLLVSVDRPKITDGSKFLKKDSRFVIMLNQMVQDCGLNANETGYDEPDMTAIINSYNSCKGDRAIIPRKKMFRFNFHAFAGLSISSMTYQYGVAYVPFNTCRTPSIGGGVDISSPVLFDRIFLTLEVWGSKPFYQGYDERPYIAGSTLRQDFLLDLTYLKFPVGVRYHFLGSKSTPYVKAGVAFSRVPTSDLRIISEAEYPDGTVYSQGIYNADYYVKTNTRRVWVGMGYVAQMGKFQLYAEVRAETGGGFMGDSFDSKSGITELDVLGGIRF